MAGIEPLGEMDHSLGSSTHLPVVNGCALVFNSFLLHSVIKKNHHTCTLVRSFKCFGTHETLEILEFCFESNIILCRIPSHTSHKLQPCDIAVFGPLKAAYRDQVERLERGDVGTIGKEHFTSLYSPARKRALTEKNIRAGWAKSGLFPFNPDRVLRDTPKPVAALTVPKACEVDVGPCPQGEVVQTPVTPVTTEALMPLQDLTIRMLMCLMRRANSAYRGTYRSLLMPPNCPLLNVPSFRNIIDS